MIGVQPAGAALIGVGDGVAELQSYHVSEIARFVGSSI